MTREEAIVDIRDNIKPIVGGKSLDMAIEALEQEQCEDAVSREEVLKQLKGCLTGGEAEYQYVKLHIDSILSVKPQEPKTGHWIEVIDEIDSLGNKTWHHKCSICGNEDSGWGNYKYCPNCGARMESEG